MHTKTSLFRGAALGAMIAMGAAAASQAATTRHIHKKVVHKAVVHEAGELALLRQEVHALQARLDAQVAAQALTQAQVQQAAATAQTAQDQIQTAQAADADATAAIIQSIPVAVAAEIDKAKPKTDAFYYKGVKITPGGFLEADGIYREHNLASDLGTPFNATPYYQSRAGHAEELRATARQSRISGLVEGQVNPDLKLSFYGEFDFQGAAQTANLNSTDSFNLRTRVVYGTMDWADEGWHLLAGDSWTLATMNAKGITPRNEMLPPTIDSQYNVGFVYARQPGLRITKDLFDKSIWAAVSIEQPQTTFGGSVPSTVVANINNGSNYYAGDTGTLTTTTTTTKINGQTVVTGVAVSGVAPATQSINHVPDVIGKLAAEEDVYGHHLHAEVFGLYRSFYEQLADFKTNNLDVGSVGAGLAGQIIPGLLDLQVSGVTGKGVGRYGTGGLPDVAFLSSGKITALAETAALATATVHATKTLDLNVMGGEEHVSRPGGGAGSYGAFAANDAGCKIEGSASSTCSGNTRLLTELSFSAWDKLYSGPWGYLRIGLQYSYLDREAFSGSGGVTPTAHNNIIMTSFRYYPF